MKVKIICFGKLDEKAYMLASQEYQKRLTRFCDLEIVELKESSFNDATKNQKLNMQNLKTQLLGAKDYVIYFLDVTGKQIDSLEFAKILADAKDQQTGKMCFVIGPSDGYDADFKNNYSRISFGAITLPHQLFRIVLLEQIYRGLMINNHQKYHK